MTLPKSNSAFFVSTKISDVPTPCFWFAADAQAAFAHYVEAVPSTALTIDNGFMCGLGFRRTGPDETPITRLLGMNGGPNYRPNETLSIYLELPDAAAVSDVFAKLTEKGRTQVYKPLQRYGFSEAYVWFADAWGVNWQISCAPNAPAAISPALLFSGAMSGQAEAATALYQSLWANSEIVRPTHSTEGATDSEFVHTRLLLGDSGDIILLDSSSPREAAFSEGGSLLVECATQAEIDHYWHGLTAGGGSGGRCGWCKDRFGVSWQIVPRDLGQWLSNPATAGKTGEALQKMGKLVIADLAPKVSGNVWAALRS